jgi:hypothetical protein
MVSEAAEVVRQEQGSIDHAFHKGQSRPVFYVQVGNRPQSFSRLFPTTRLNQIDGEVGPADTCKKVWVISSRLTVEPRYCAIGASDPVQSQEQRRSCVGIIGIAQDAHCTLAIPFRFPDQRIDDAGVDVGS